MWTKIKGFLLSWISTWSFKNKLAKKKLGKEMVSEVGFEPTPPSRAQNALRAHHYNGKV